MKPDWQKNDEDAQEKADKIKDALRPNFMKKKPAETPAEEPTNTAESPQVNKPDWMDSAGKKAQAEEAEPPTIDPELIPEPEPAPEPENTAVPETYTVQAGDSLSSIAQRIYGDGNFWVDIWKLNQGQIADPNVIRPGQVLNLPPVP